MAPTDFEILMNLVGPETVKRDYQIPSSYSGSREIGSNIAIWATGDSYTRLQCIFRISKQTISQTVPEVRRAIAKALMESNTSKKNVYCMYRAHCFAHKIHGFEH
jgi:hypothetical protein